MNLGNISLDPKTFGQVQQVNQVNNLNTVGQLSTQSTTNNSGISTDQWNGVSYQTQNVPLYYLFNDPNKPQHPLNYKLMQRLEFFGIKTSEDYLKAASTPFKRNLISMLGGVFLSKNDREYLNYQIKAWATQADLLRTGVDLNTARLLQVSGVTDVAMLARYSNPIDKGALYAAMGANCLQYGYRMPSFGEVSSAIERAKNLPPKIYWY